MLVRHPVQLDDLTVVSLSHVAVTDRLEEIHPASSGNFDRLSPVSVRGPDISRSMTSSLLLCVRIVAPSAACCRKAARVIEVRM